MHIKIVDYTKLDINKIEALNFIVDSIYDIYKKEKDSLTSEFLNLTPELFIDSQCGHVYSTCSIDVFKLIDDVFSKTTEIKLFVVFELSLDFEGWEGNLVRRYELFFGLFHNHKCSSFILNHKFNKLLIPKFIEYFMYAIDDNINEENIPLHFNEFENINETRSKLIGLCYSKLERVTSLSDFIDNKFLRYWNYDDEKDDLFASFRRMKWISPYYDVEGMYNNTNVLSNDFHTMLSPIESFNKRNKNEYNYTIVIDTETNGLPLDYNETFPYLSYPSPVQISWAIFDEYNNLVEFRDYIIKQNIPITKESTDIHGINDKIARLKGVDISSGYCIRDEVATSNEDRELGEKLARTRFDLLIAGDGSRPLHPDAQGQSAAGTGYTTSAEYVKGQMKSAELSDFVVTRDGDLIIVTLGVDTERTVFAGSTELGTQKMPAY